jgi:hypothetical protein
VRSFTKKKTQSRENIVGTHWALLCMRLFLLVRACAQAQGLEVPLGASDVHLGGSGLQRAKQRAAAAAAAAASSGGLALPPAKAAAAGVLGGLGLQAKLVRRPLKSKAAAEARESGRQRATEGGTTHGSGSEGGSGGVAATKRAKTTSNDTGNSGGGLLGLDYGSDLE